MSSVTSIYRAGRIRNRVLPITTLSKQQQQRHIQNKYSHTINLLIQPRLWKRNSYNQFNQYRSIFTFTATQLPSISSSSYFERDDDDDDDNSSSSWYCHPSIMINNTSSSLSSNLSLSRCNYMKTTIRWKRNDGNRFHNRERKPTKKQRKKYNKELQKIQMKQNKHSPPGSKAGIRRESERLRIERLLNPSSNTDTDELEYDINDALLDDLIGNVKQSQPTPIPAYYGHKQRKYFNIVADKMDTYKQYHQQLLLVDNNKSNNGNESNNNNNVTLPQNVELPTDNEIAMALRAYRDKNGTKHNPIGIVNALQHILYDLNVPINILGEYTYNTLLSCSRTIKEGRRIIQMMNENNIPINAYTYSILVDIYAKLGDYQGCVNIHTEMLQKGISPTLPSYTSLLAACYKVCNNGQIGHSIRAKAAKVGWEQWREMRIVGIEPDVMAYGAILRLAAAQGQPEQAINLLEEMQRFNILPTTLCYTSALKAVARSHAIAIRYEKGFSKRYRKRENITLHHGKLTRQILILAEQSAIDFDDGFVAALIQCAAVAGDVATAKAIYVTNQIRKLDTLRTIGPNTHIAQLRGEEENQDFNSNISIEHIGQEKLIANGGSSGSNGSNVVAGNNSNMAIQSYQKKPRYPSYGEREYGKDSRILSAILHACANSVNQNDIGTMWQGRENQGYLCINSLRLIATPKRPQYTDNTIPGQKITDNLTWVGEHFDQDGYRNGKRKSRKFEGVYVDETAGGTNLDDLDETFSKMFLNDEGQLLEQYRKSTPDDIWLLKYGKDRAYVNAAPLHSKIDQQKSIKTLEAGSHSEPNTTSAMSTDDSESTPQEEMYFDYDIMRWKSRTKIAEANFTESDNSITIENVHTKKLHPPTDNYSTEKDGKNNLYFDYDTMKWQTRLEENVDNDNLTKETISSTITNSKDVEEVNAKSNEELCFDNDAMRWKTRSRIARESDSIEGLSDSEEGILAQNDLSSKDESDNDLDENIEVDEEREFELFYADLKKEVADSGETEDVTEEEARELFTLMKDEYNEMMSTPLEELGIPDTDADDEMDELPLSIKTKTDTDGFKSVSSSPVVKSQVASQTASTQISGTQTFYADDWYNSKPGMSSTDPDSQSYPSIVEKDLSIDDNFELDPSMQSELNSPASVENSVKTVFTDSVEVIEDDDMEQIDTQIAILREALPTFSDERLRKIQKAFHKSLDSPPFLELIPLVRENMPDYITASWLKKMASMTAKYVVHQAKREGLLDRDILNSALSLHTSSGSIDVSLDFHAMEFEEQGVKPNAYSDRLVLQMLLNNNRLSRALAFKQKIEESDRKLDVKSYGSLVEYCSRRKQLGSAMLLVKECLSVHGTPPSEASLSDLRILSRHLDTEEEIESLIGPNPIAWLKHGEANLKREMSKRGRRNVQFIQNQVVRI